MRDGEAQELAGLPELSGASPMLRAAEGRWAQLAQGSQTRRCGVAVLKAEAAAAGRDAPFFAGQTQLEWPWWNMKAVLERLPGVMGE